MDLEIIQSHRSQYKLVSSVQWSGAQVVSVCKKNISIYIDIEKRYSKIPFIIHIIIYVYCIVYMRIDIFSMQPLFRSVWSSNSLLLL